ncbi:MAG: transposase [Verrucomicrobiales bacterium]
MNPQQPEPHTQPPRPPDGGDASRAELGLGVPGGWYSRGYLPHLNTPGIVQSVIFRLADSLPVARLAQLEEELSCVAKTDPDRAATERRRRIEVWLDAGMGCRALAHPSVAATVQETMLKWDGDRYRLVAWCVMPNHVHALLEPKVELSRILQSWKSYTGRWAMERNAELGLGVPGKRFWMRETWDRYIRDARHFGSVRSYIERNPVAAGLCSSPEEWPWSSAGHGDAPTVADVEVWVEKFGP